MEFLFEPFYGLGQNDIYNGKLSGEDGAGLAILPLNNNSLDILVPSGIVPIQSRAASWTQGHR